MSASSQMLPPLPERMRPRTLDQYVGQRHLVGEGCILRKMIESGNLSSFILWGPPGVGKTTLAHIIAETLQREFYTLSAVSAGVKDVRDVFEKAKGNSIFNQKGAPILFIDEIHRFSKAQQDALLGAVENGTVVLIGATTENPSFEVITPLLSRCQVFVLKSLEKADLQILLDRALKEDVLLSPEDHNMCGNKFYAYEVTCDTSSCQIDAARVENGVISQETAHMDNLSCKVFFSFG